MLRLINSKSNCKSAIICLFSFIGCLHIYSTLWKFETTPVIIDDDEFVYNPSLPTGIGNPVILPSHVNHFIPNNNNNNNDNPHESPPIMPSLVLLGPEKTGTRTFISTMGKFPEIYEQKIEIYYWTKLTSLGCLPQWTVDQWDQYITQYLNHSDTKNIINSKDLQTFFQLIADSIVITDNRASQCNTQRFIRRWNRFYRDSNQTHCLHPGLVASDNDDDKSGLTLPYCWFIEKSPNYSRNPLVGLIFSNYFERIKLIHIIRNPIKLIWSWVYAFHKKYIKDLGKDNDRVARDLFKYFRSNSAAKIMRKECVNINNNWNIIKSIDIGNVNVNVNSKRELMMPHYVSMMKEYLNYRFVLNKTNDLSFHSKESMVWVSLMYPTLMFYILAYDQVYGFENWNQFRLIQFEYLYKNMSISMNVIKCWLQTNQQYTSDFDLQNRCKQSYHHLKFGLKIKKINARASGSMSDEFKKQFEQLLSPCYQCLFHEIENSPQLLLGEWIPWT